MSEEKAKALGLTPLGYVRSYAYAALDPARPAAAGARLRGADRARPRRPRRSTDMDLVDMHEAFAAQVLSQPEGVRVEGVRREEARAQRSRSARSTRAKLNVNGGSIALGHPFAATGARMILQTLRELERRKGQHALLTVCAAGGLGAALVLERE